MTQAILLIPAQNDPYRLLAEGPCGARMPIAYRSVHGEWRASGKKTLLHYHQEEALVLAWEGEVVPEGIQRAMRCAWGAEHPGVSSPEKLFFMTNNMDMAHAEEFGAACVTAMGGRLEILPY